MNATEVSKRWSNIQTYGFALVCLLLGVAVGYVAHPPKPVLAIAPQTPIAATSARMPSPEQLKQMSETQVQPMLVALQKAPADPVLLDKVGTEYFHGRDFAKAADYFGRAVKIKPTADGYVRLAAADYYSGSGEQAITALNHALELDPKAPTALFNLGMLKLQVKKDPKGAIDTWQRLVREHPDLPQRANVEKMIAQVTQQMNSPAAAKTDKSAM
jgi:cytochrome c-type biogenesis protein CcmH/NrfG